MRLLLAARPAARLDRIPKRIKRMVVYGLGQKKFLVGEQPSGIAHAVVFWGFVVLLLQVITLFGRAFDAGWSIPGFAADEPLGPPFFIARDLLEACVIVAVTYMLYRRLVLHVPRLFGLGRAEQRYREAPHWEGILILVLILLIVVGGLLYDAGRLVADDIHGNERDFAPLAALVAAALDGLGPLLGAHRQRGRMVAAQRHRPGLPVPAAAVQALPRDHRDPERVLRQAPAARRRAAAGDHPRAGRAGGRAGRPARGPGRGRLALGPELEAGARRVLVHRVRPLHGRLPRDRRRARRWRRGR